MTFRILPIFYAFFAFTAAALHGKPLLMFYDFDGIRGNSAPDLSGDQRNGRLVGTAKVGGPGSGVSARPDDLALDNAEAKMGEMSADSGGAIRLDGGFGPLASFTICGWFKTDGPQSLAEQTRLFSVTQKGEAKVLVYYYQGYLRLGIGDDNKVLAATHRLTDAQNEWAFFAFTYDGTKTSDNVRFYTGSSKVPLVQTAAGSNGLGVVSFGDPTATLTFGADSRNARSIDGWLDQIRVYGVANGPDGALSRSDLEQIMNADLSGGEVPNA